MCACVCVCVPPDTAHRRLSLFQLDRQSIGWPDMLHTHLTLHRQTAAARSHCSAAAPVRACGGGDGGGGGGVQAYKCKMARIVAYIHRLAFLAPVCMRMRMHVRVSACNARALTFCAARAAAPHPLRALQRPVFVGGVKLSISGMRRGPFSKPNLPSQLIELTLLLCRHLPTGHHATHA